MVSDVAAVLKLDATISVAVDFTKTIMMSDPATSAGSDDALGLTVSISPVDRTSILSPSLLTASTCALLMSYSTTSFPAADNFPPRE